jgi:hypothetical protein
MDIMQVTTTHPELRDMTAITRRLMGEMGLDHERAAELLGLSRRDGRDFLQDGLVVEPGSESFRRVVMFMRLYHALHVLHGGDAATSLEWLDAVDADLMCTPWQAIVASSDGFEQVVDRATDLVQCGASAFSTSPH